MKGRKCLVTEAMDKCQCDDCKMYRKLRDICIKQIIGSEVYDINLNALKEAGMIG